MLAKHCAKGLKEYLRIARKAAVPHVLKFKVLTAVVIIASIVTCLDLPPASNARCYGEKLDNLRTVDPKLIGLNGPRANNAHLPE